MGPSIPSLDLTLVNSWLVAFVNTLWPLLGVLAGVVIGSVIVRAFRKALAGGGGE